MANDFVTRVERLIALTASPHEEEARTAAFQACRIIREQGLRVVDANATRAAPRGWASPPRDDRWSHVARRDTGPRKPARRVGVFTHVRASRSGKCSHCGEGFSEGDDIAIFTDDGAVTHRDCAKEPA